MPPPGKRAKFDNATVSRILQNLGEDSSDPDNRYVLGLITDQQREAIQATRRARKQVPKVNDVDEEPVPADESELPQSDIVPSDLNAFVPGYLKHSEWRISKWVTENFVKANGQDLRANYVFLFFRRFAESEKWIQTARQTASFKRYLDICCRSKYSRDNSSDKNHLLKNITLLTAGRKAFVKLTKLPLSKIFHDS